MTKNNKNNKNNSKKNTKHSSENTNRDTNRNTKAAHFNIDDALNEEAIFTLLDFIKNFISPNKQKETNEKNNVLAQKITVTSAQIDFAITNFTTSASTVNVGGSFNLS